jgi:hypothetical protein
MRTCVLTFCLGFWVTASAVALAQPATSTWAPNRTWHGHPDLQGQWTNSTQTPLERPAALGNRRVYTPEEAAAVERQAHQSDAERAAPLNPDRAPPTGGRVGQEANDAYIDTFLNIARINGEYRTSLIIEPEDGRLPYRPDGRNKDIYAQWREAGFGPSDGPEIRTMGDRCLHIGAQTPPMVVPLYNANFQIVQTASYVMILSEMINDARIIRLHGEHQPSIMQKWLGDSVGRWEGDTLIVQTRNFKPEASNFRIRSSAEFELTESFTLTDDDAIHYRYTVTDPVIYSQSFTVEMLLRRRPAGEHIYEFACHEGNYSMASILLGARVEESLAATAESSPPQ